MPDSKLPEQRDIKTESGNYSERIEKNYIQADTVNIYEQNGCHARNAATQKVTGKKQLTFVLTGTIGDVDKAKLKAIQAHLRKISGDAELTIIDAEEGSIRLKLEGSPEGLKKLKELFESEELTEVLCIPVEDVYFTSNEMEDSEESTENDYKSRLVREIVEKGAVGRDLSGVDLSDTNLGSVNLSCANLSDANLGGIDFSGADLSNTNLSNANLSNANLSGAKLSCANLSDTDLSGTELGYTDLSSTDLSGTDLSKTYHMGILWINSETLKISLHISSFSEVNSLPEEKPEQVTIMLPAVFSHMNFLLIQSLSETGYGEFHVRIEKKNHQYVVYLNNRRNGYLWSEKQLEVLQNAYQSVIKAWSYWYSNTKVKLPSFPEFLQHRQTVRTSLCYDTTLNTQSQLNQKPKQSMIVLPTVFSHMNFLLIHSLFETGYGEFHVRIEKKNHQHVVYVSTHITDRFLLTQSESDSLKILYNAILEQMISNLYKENYR
ncbi:MAG: pentapeptide repeat-containing protein [Cyanobacteria bacterium P01_A01_bin.80]